MKKTLLLLFICFANLLYAQSPKSLYEQLVSVNEQWKNQPDVDPSLKSTPAKAMTEQQLVQFHLQQTELMLRKRDVSKLSAAQRKQRAQNLNTLNGYLKNGIFPINDLHQNRQPYFIDKYNTYCAVGYLMKMSGADAMAREIHDKQNFSYLFDINHPQLMDWASKSGLTLGELALIQPGYGGEVPVTLMEIHYNNAGADVNEYVEIRQSTGQLIGMPSFDSVIFADAGGNIYKRLPIASMTAGTFNSIFYYTFPSTENFADAGSILIKRTYSIYSKDTISIITYNSSNVTIKNYNYSSFTTTTYNVSESETTPVGNSLGFTGLYNTTSWNLVTGINSMGAINPGASFPTPITLSKFDYTLNNKKVNLNWETVSEINNNYFSIEKSSDGINFQSIGKINGAGNSNNVKQYSFTDDKAMYINHYRLKQVDFDGKWSYSKILYVKMPQANPLTIISNPVKNQLQIQINAEASKITSLTIFDFMGRKISSYTASNGIQQLDVSKLLTGKYVLQLLTTDGTAFRQTFLKTE